MSKELAKTLATAAVWLGAAAIAYALGTHNALTDNAQALVGAAVGATFIVWYFG